MRYLGYIDRNGDFRRKAYDNNEEANRAIAIFVSRGIRVIEYNYEFLKVNELKAHGCSLEEFVELFYLHPEPAPIGEDPETGYMVSSVPEFVLGAENETKDPLPHMMSEELFCRHYYGPDEAPYVFINGHPFCFTEETVDMDGWMKPVMYHVYKGKEPKSYMELVRFRIP